MYPKAACVLEPKGSDPILEGLALRCPGLENSVLQQHRRTRRRGAGSGGTVVRAQPFHTHYRVLDGTNVSAVVGAWPIPRLFSLCAPLHRRCGSLRLRVLALFVLLGRNIGPCAHLLLQHGAARVSSTSPGEPSRASRVDRCCPRCLASPVRFMWSTNTACPSRRRARGRSRHEPRGVLVAFGIDAPICLARGESAGSPVTWHGAATPQDVLLEATPGVVGRCR